MKLKLESIEDHDYGIKLGYPADWTIVRAGEGGIWAFKDNQHDVAIVVFIVTPRFSNLDVKNLAEVALISGLLKNPEKTKVLEKIDKSNSIKVAAKVTSKKKTYKFLGYLLQFSINIKSYQVTKKVLSSVIFDEAYLGTDVEPLIAKVIVNLPLIAKLKKGKLGVGDPFIKIEYPKSALYQKLRWSAEVPVSLNVHSDNYGFAAYTDRIYISINAAHLYISLKDYVEGRVAGIFHDKLNTNKFKIINQKEKTSQIFYHATTTDNLWQLFGYWTLQTYYNIEKNEDFKMVLEKVAVYPSKAEIDVIPMISRVFTSFTTGPYWLYEDFGLAFTSKISSIPSITLPKISSVKPVKRTTTTTKSAKQVTSSASKTYTQWRNKIKEDLKRIADWEKNLWTETYQTIKMSDVITGMYSLEDKRGKTKLVTTRNIVSPMSHNIWKPKQDVLWTSNTLLATKKPLVPKNKFLWEKLSWHWDNEIKRIKKETENKKKFINSMW